MGKLGHNAAYEKTLVVYIYIYMYDSGVSHISHSPQFH